MVTTRHDDGLHLQCPTSSSLTVGYTLLALVVQAIGPGSVVAERIGRQAALAARTCLCHVESIARVQHVSSVAGERRLE